MMHPTAAVRPHPARRSVLALAFLVLLVEGYDQFAVGTVGPALLSYEPWHAGHSVMGVIGSATSLGLPFGSFAAGWAVTRWGLRRPLLFGVAWTAFTMLCGALAPTLGLFIAARFGTGIGIGLLVPLISTLVSTFAPPRHRALLLTVTLSAIAFGGTLSTLAGKFLLPHMHFQWLFLPGLLGVLLLPAIWRLAPAEAVSLAGAGGRARLREVLAPRFRYGTALFWVAAIMGLALVYSTTAWLPVTMVKAGYDVGSSFDFTIAFTLGAGFGNMALGALADRGPLREVTLGCFSLAVVALFVLSTPQPHWLLLAVSALAGIGALGAQNMVIASMASFYPAELRGAGLGLALAVGRVGAIAGPTYVGVATDLIGSPKAGFYAFMLPALIGAVAVTALPHWRRGQHDNAE
ncbi:MFS transporter, partial [Nocardia tenerifensis]